MKSFFSKRLIKYGMIALSALLIAIGTFTFNWLRVPVNGDGMVSICIAKAADEPIKELPYTDLGDGTYEYSNKWLCSYETLLFDTLDGDIGLDEYAKADIGYYYRTKPKNESQFDWTDNASLIKGKKLVNVIAGHAYYDEFLTAEGAKYLWDKDSEYYLVSTNLLPSGSVLRVQSDATNYWDTANIKNHPQPERKEIIVELPPLEPPTPLPEHHSIAYDTTTNSGVKNATSSYSWSHECTGDDRLLVVGHGHNTGFGPDKTVTAVTFNGDACDLARGDYNSASGYRGRSYIYYLIAPDTGGSYTVAVTLSGTVTCVGGAISYTGANQDSQPDAVNGATGSGDDATASVTTDADNSWVVSVVQSTDTSITCENTERWNDGTFMSCGGSDTNAPKTPAGNQVMSWTDISLSAKWVISAASFAPATEATPDISNTPPSEDLGVVAENSSYYAHGSAPSNPVEDGECTFEVTNNSGAAVDITIKATNFTGGNGWTLTSGSPGSATVRVTTYYSGQNPASGVVLTTEEQSFLTSLADSASKKWDFKLETGTFTDGVQKSNIITLTASLS